MKEPLVKISLSRIWNKPQQLIVQELSFNSVKKIKKEKNIINIELCNKKTGFRADIEIDSSLFE